MTRITLTLNPDVLTALVSGQAVELTARLHVAKARNKTPLTPDQQERHKVVSALWGDSRPDDNLGRVWKALSRLSEQPTSVLADALSTALDWTSGLKYTPEFFVKDYPEWVERSRLNAWQAEDARDMYRKRRGAV